MSSDRSIAALWAPLIREYRSSESPARIMSIPRSVMPRRPRLYSGIRSVTSLIRPSASRSDTFALLSAAAMVWAWSFA